MSVEKLQRVLWRVRKNYPNVERYPWLALQRAVMLEIGTDPRTYWCNKKALIRLQWVRTENKAKFTLSGKDLTDT